MSAPVNIVLAAVGTSTVISALQGVQGALAGLSSAGLSATAALAGIGKTLSGGVGFNAQLETARLGVAAVLKQFDDVGKFRDFDDAITESAKALELLKQSAVTSPASFSTLVAAFQGTVGPMTSAGIALRDQVSLIVNMSQALSGLGIQEAQILQELRALITGNINANAAAAKILQITAEDITQARGKGQLYQFLADKIKAFAEAGDRGSHSLNTLKSNLADAYEQRAAAATEDLTESLKKFYSQLTDLVNSPQFQQFVGVFARTAQGAASLGASVSGALQHVNGAVVGNLTEGFGTIVGATIGTGIAKKIITALGGVFGKEGTTLAASLAEGLTRLLPAAFGFILGRTLGNMMHDLRAAPALQARAGGGEVLSAIEQGGAIDSEEKRVAAVAKLADLEKQVATARAVEDSKLLSSNDALKVYDQQLLSIRNSLAALNSDWAQHQIALNQAQSAADRLAAAEAAAAAWLKSADAEKLRGEIAAGVISRTAAADRLANARAFLSLLERNIAVAKQEAAAGRDSAVNQKVLLQATADREALLQDIAALETRIAQQARNALEAEQVRLQSQLSALDADFAQTDADKWARRRELLTASVAAAQAYLDKVTAIRDAHPQDAQAQANVLSAQQSLGTAESALAGIGPDPDSFFQQMQAGIAQLRESWGTAAQNMAATMTGTFEAARGASSDFLFNVLSGAQNMRQAWGGALLSIGQQFLRMVTDMVTKLLWKATIERGLTALGVATHVGGEATKTAATAAGVGTRLLLIIKEALAAVYHGAVAAFSAMASIPYVGPFLAAGALAAALALGIGLVSKIGHKDGGYTAQGPRDQPAGIVHAGEWVAPKWMVEDPVYGATLAGLEAARQGQPVPSGVERPGYYSWGGFVKLLGRGMPRWLQDPLTRNLVDKWNPVTGTKLYGEPVSGYTTAPIDYISPAATAAMERAAASDRALSQFPPAGRGDTTAADAPGGRPLTVAILNPERDRSVIEQLQRDPHADVWFVNQLQKHRRTIGVKV
jgi:hypothetical protein